MSAGKAPRNKKRHYGKVFNPLRACASKSGPAEAGYRDAVKYPTAHDMLADSTKNYSWQARRAPPSMTGGDQGLAEGKWCNKISKPDDSYLKHYVLKGLKGKARVEMQAKREAALVKSHEIAVMAFERSLRPEDHAAIKAELGGKIPVCWCKPHLPCHTDVLTRIAQSESLVDSPVVDNPV